VEYVIVGLAVVLYILVGASMGIGAFRSARRNAHELEALRSGLAELSKRVQELRADAGQPEPIAPATPEVVEAAVDTMVETPAAEAAAIEPTQWQEAAEPAGRSDETIERALTSRWMLWLGAVALALGGAFLVKHAIDEGWAGPIVRVTLGFLLGCGLTVWGEWLRRRPLQRAIAAIGPNYVPPALSAAGVWIAFASVYAAAELYDLLPPLVAFLLLGAISAGAVFLSLLQGPFMALLGLIGGDVTPLLIPSQQPLAWGLFAYLLCIVAAALFVVRCTAAWWLAWTALAGAAAWALLWFAGFWQPGDAAALGAFLLCLAGCALLLPERGLLAWQPPEQPRNFLDGIGHAGAMAWLALVTVAALIFILLRMQSYGGVSLVVLTLFVVLCLGVGRRAPLFDGLAVLAAVLTLLAMATWHLPQILPATLGHLPPQVEAAPQGYVPVPIVPPGTSRFLACVAGFAALFGGAGFVLLFGARRVALWAAVSAATPVLLLAIAYWRIEAFAVSFSWALVALVVAGGMVAAAWRVERRRAAPEFTIALAAYAAAAAAALGLGAAMTLQAAWLTVALAVEVPVLAWIGLRLKLEVLRPVALVVALVVLGRLVLNLQVVDYPLGMFPVLNWILYGYGVPAAAFLTAAIWFRRQADDALVLLLEAGSLAFVALLVTLETHALLAGSLHVPPQGLLEPSLLSIAWLLLAIGLATGGGWARRPTAVWGGRLLAGAAAVQIVGWQVGLENPLWSETPIGRLPILNLLLLAYGIPAALSAFYGWRALRGTAFVWGFAAALAFLELSLEVRHGFQGSVLSGPSTSDGEWYCYSAAWLGFAGVLLALGIRGGSIGLRYASLAVLLLTVAKVFLSDMAALTGLYRVVSFVGLGLCLIGVSYLYQRFVFPPEKARALPSTRQRP
jgi:uncharacterized membrane protein